MRPAEGEEEGEGESCSGLGDDDGEYVDAGGGVDDGGSGGEDDEDDEDSEDSEDGEDWRGRAARVIQCAWRRRWLAGLETDAPGSELGVSDDEGRAAGSGSQSAACCIVCFALVPMPGGGPGEGGDAPLCSDCVSRLAASDACSSIRRARSPLSSGNAKTPARLTQLLRVEAKVHDQLELLRDQHRVLLAQQEQLQAAKRAQAEQAAAARAVARERRRHVRMLLERRKREEELRFQQFVAPDEAEEAAVTLGASKKKHKKKPKTPARTSGPRSIAQEAAEPPSDPSPAPLPPPKDKQTDKRLQSEIQEHTRQLWQRRKQTLDCYSQDLSPLVNGSKPKRLPVPAALLAPAPRHSAAKRSTPSKQSVASPVVADSVRPSNQGVKPRRHKKIPSGGVKLRPLPVGSKAKSSADASNNQLDELESVHFRSAKASASPWTASSPLTAEIKPVSWIHELGEDLAGDDTNLSSANSSLLGLHSVMEDFDDDDGGGFGPSQSQPPSKYKRYADLYGSDTGDSSPSTPVSSAASLFPPLLRQLPPPVAASSTAKAPALTQPAGAWEYSTERLAGLLEKYNVSVKEAGGSRGGS